MTTCKVPCYTVPEQDRCEDCPSRLPQAQPARDDKDCCCADPENCTQVVPGYRCRRVTLNGFTPSHVAQSDLAGIEEALWTLHSYESNRDDAGRNYSEADITKMVSAIRAACTPSTTPQKPDCEGRVPTRSEMVLDMDVDAIKDAIGKAYPSLDDMTREMLWGKVDRLHGRAFNNLFAKPGTPELAALIEKLDDIEDDGSEGMPWSQEELDLILAALRCSASATPRRHWVYAAAEACRPSVANVDDDGAYCYGSRKHLTEMLDKIRDGDFSPTKACRWLGWVQACLYLSGWMSLDQAKEINRAANNSPDGGVKS